MRVSKKALLESINTALTRHEQQCRDWEDAVEWWRDRQRRAWLEQKQPQWKALRDMITKSLKDKQPITTDMVESVLVRSNGYRSSYISDHTYNPSSDPSSPIIRGGVKVRRPDAPEGIRDMQGLKAFLESSPDEEFSLTSLQRLGFKAPAYVFRAAVSG